MLTFSLYPISPHFQAEKHLLQPKVSLHCSRQTEWLNDGRKMEKAERALGRRKSRKSFALFLETLDADLNFYPKWEAALRGRQIRARLRVSLSRRTTQKTGNLAVCFDMKGRLFMKLFYRWMAFRNDDEWPLRISQHLFEMTATLSHPTVVVVYP